MEDIAPENNFISYELGEQAIIAGVTFSDANLRYIQNQISAHAHDHLRITYTDIEPHKSAIQAAYIKGAIEALTHLTTAHKEVQIGLKEALESAST